MEDIDFDKALEYARHTYTIRFTFTEAKEGTDAFLKKCKSDRKGLLS